MPRLTELVGAAPLVPQADTADGGSTADATGEAALAPRLTELLGAAPLVPQAGPPDSGSTETPASGSTETSDNGSTGTSGSGSTADRANDADLGSQVTGLVGAGNREEQHDTSQGTSTESSASGSTETSDNGSTGTSGSGSTADRANDADLGSQVTGLVGAGNREEQHDTSQGTSTESSASGSTETSDNGSTGTSGSGSTADRANDADLGSQVTGLVGAGNREEQHDTSQGTSTESSASRSTETSANRSTGTSGSGSTADRANDADLGSQVTGLVGAGNREEQHDTSQGTSTESSARRSTEPLSKPKPLSAARDN